MSNVYDLIAIEFDKVRQQAMIEGKPIVICSQVYKEVLPPTISKEQMEESFKRAYEADRVVSFAKHVGNVPKIWINRIF